MKRVRFEMKSRNHTASENIIVVKKVVGLGLVNFFEANGSIPRPHSLVLAIVDKRNPDNLPRETVRKLLTLQNPEEQNEEEKNERKKDEILIQVVLRCR
ncbi:hypothetical protein RUM43_005426 [Polyplax serrata]|uniref:Uncharacterized protein n=1 Tax=Polyplax serrata TaxID=468196 RepID=A0AAN8S2W0_POLSC